MYKMLIFLKKDSDAPIVEDFKNRLVPYLETMTNSKVKIGKIDGSAMLEDKFSYFCEINMPTKDEFDKIMASSEGKKFSRGIVNFIHHISIFYVDFNE